MQDSRSDYRVAPAQRMNRSLGMGLLHLPGQYLKSVFLPSASTFAEEQDNASWGLVWIQLFILIIVPVVLGLFRGLFKDTSIGIATNSNVAFDILATFTVGASIGALILKIIVVPVAFFIGVAVQYLFAKAFGGSGRYMIQSYTALLYQVPLALISGIIITFLVYRHISTFFYAPLVSLVLAVYGVILNVLAIEGVHRLGRGKATAAVILPYILGALITIGLIVALAHYITTLLHPLH